MISSSAACSRAAVPGVGIDRGAVLVVRDLAAALEVGEAVEDVAAVEIGPARHRLGAGTGGHPSGWRNRTPPAGWTGCARREVGKQLGKPRAEPRIRSGRSPGDSTVRQPDLSLRRACRRLTPRPSDRRRRRCTKLDQVCTQRRAIRAPSQARRGRGRMPSSRSSGNRFAISRPVENLQRQARMSCAPRCCRRRRVPRVGKKNRMPHRCRIGRPETALSAFHCGSESRAIRV